MFEGVQEEVEVKPMYSFARSGWELHIYNDAPCQGVGCVLMQEEKCSTLFIKSTKEAWVELPSMFSGVIHCEAWK